MVQSIYISSCLGFSTGEDARVVPAKIPLAWCNHHMAIFCLSVTEECVIHVLLQADPQCLELMGGCWDFHQGNLLSHLQLPEGIPLKPYSQNSRVRLGASIHYTNRLYRSKQHSQMRKLQRGLLAMTQPVIMVLDPTQLQVKHNHAACTNCPCL